MHRRTPGLREALAVSARFWHNRRMGQLSASHLGIIVISIAMWVGAAWVIVIAVRKMGLFGRRGK